MKKKIYLLITFIVSLFLFSGRVDAAKKMQCLYEGDWLNVCKILVQDENGEISLYVNNDDTCKFGDSDFKITGLYSLNFEKTSVYNSESGELTECPNYVSAFPGMKVLVGDHDIHFYDENGKFELIDKIYDKDIDTSDFYLEFSSSTDYSDEIANTEWIGKCEYGYNAKFYLYFNQEKMIFVNGLSGRSTSRMKFSLNDLLTYTEDVKYCPSRIYEYYVSSTAHNLAGPGEYYLAKPNGITGIIGTDVFTITEYSLTKGDYVGETSDTDDKKEPIDDCGDLFGEDLLKKINDVMNIVKIAVPILLIAFGIVDFTKAVFAGSTDDMNKSQKIFFKRIIAAVLVFVAPIFINLILSLANEVWGNISADTCIEQSK